jgi:hypothetical protein
MAKANITQYSSTPSSNTDINNINIDENCPASGLNNAIRELMAHLKNVDTGSQALTALSVTGDTTISTGDLLVGTTTNRPAEFSHPDGFSVRGDTVGQIQNTVTDNANALFNRDGTDGTIINLRKEGVEVGYIGVANTDQLSIGTPDGSQMGLRFDGDLEHILPANASGAKKDALADLGSSTARWQDLYLSGGAYIGGTGSANYLDDYEEGSFSGYLRDATSSGNFVAVDYSTYTKIGNVVTVFIRHDNINTSGLTSGNSIFFTGLPFTSVTDGTEAVGCLWWQYINISGTGHVVPRIQGNVTYIRIEELIDNALDRSVTVSNLTNGVSDIRVQITYKVA